MFYRGGRDAFVCCCDSVGGGLCRQHARPRLSAQTVIVGNDEKTGWTRTGKPIVREPGHDTLTIIDMSKPATPKMRDNPAR